jgi:quercetin dioxygenase-like cupin family protein
MASASASASLYSNPLPTIKRYITTHNSDGKSVFSRDIDEDMKFWKVGNDPDMPVGFFLGYTTSTFPAPLLADRDVKQYKGDLAHSQGSGLVKHGGTVMRYVDYPPKCASPMHRTISLDYGFVLQGNLVCVLDSGETMSLKPGDVVVQRGTMHQWVNSSNTEWARMVYVLQDADGVEICGKRLVEDLGDMDGVPGSH